MDMVNISKALWGYCFNKEIILTAEFLPGIQNQIANGQSLSELPRFEQLETGQVHFQEITRILGQVGMNLFADRTNAQVLKIISWKPDLESWATDAFT